MRRTVAGGITALMFGLLLAGTAGSKEPFCPSPSSPRTGPSLVYPSLQLPDVFEFDFAVELAGNSIAAEARPPDETSAAAGNADLALHLDTGSVLKPYLGAGIAAPAEPVRPALPVAVSSGIDHLPAAYLLSAGVGCALGGNAQMDLGYRYIPGNLLEQSDALGSSRLRDDEAHNISINLKFVY
jgi:opacity protein-like surface antigen